MKRVILNGPGFCAVTEDDRLVEYIRKDDSDQCGDILMGKIDRIMPGLDCAFVNIGRKKDGFLPLKDTGGSFRAAQLRSGETVMLQIRKEENGGKGALLTRDLSIPGRTVILMPMNRYIGVSSRIEDQAVRERLKEAGHMIAGDRFGLILRRAAAAVSEETIREETESLYQRWQVLRHEAQQAGTPGRILLHGSVTEQLAADYCAGGIDEIIETETPGPAILRQLKQASERKLLLPGGGNIVIDRCEAMTVIDVNTASARGESGKEQTVLATNLEACERIAEQVRLRNLSGILLIDFIDMDSETDRSLVSGRLAACFAADRIKTVIHGWTTLGLMEMTRKRTRPDLYEELFTACDACGGRGRILKGMTE